MSSHLVWKSFDFQIHYIPRRCRTIRTTDVSDKEAFGIEEINPVLAPVVYRISCEPGAEAHEIRSFNGSLWWPVMQSSQPLAANKFLGLIEGNWDIARKIIDPMERVFGEGSQPIKDFFANIFLSKRPYTTTQEAQLSLARKAFAKLSFCDGRVLVAAGDPVWYAVRKNMPRDSFELVVGHSDLDRCNLLDYSFPGPDRGVRRTAARRGRAFGLQELNTKLPSLRAFEIRYKSRIITTGDHEPVSATDLCSRALAHYLWEIAPRNPALAEVMPAVAHARPFDPPPDDLPYRQILQQLLSVQDPTLKKRLFYEIMEGEIIFDRQNSNELAEEDDEALFALSLAARFAS